jgi:DNA-binding LacI/PurR family transcriptional regulator
MSPRRSPFELPKRVSLSEQAAEAIRKAVKEGMWDEYLPSERRLCEMFQVSRPTIRAALHILTKDGWLDIRQGRRNRILTPQRQDPTPAKRLVGIVTMTPISQFSSTVFQAVSEMRAHLLEHGFASEILICRARSAQAQRRKLAEFIRQNRVYCCALLSVSRDLQRWVAEHAVPALVLGSCDPALKLPSLDVDFRSTCRHAAGIFLRKGHRRMALVVPDSGTGGDLACEQGFCEAVGQGRGGDAQVVIVRHDGTAADITTRLDTLFDSAQPPTALLVSNPLHVHIVIIYLLKRGISVPDTVSLIARDQDRVFEVVNPPISHYYLEGTSFSHRLSRLMLKLVNHGYIALEPHLIFPKFFAGGTVKEPAR